MPCSLYVQIVPQNHKVDVGVLTGVISTCGFIERLSRDQLLPEIFLRRLKVTNAPYVCVIVFAIIGLAMFAMVDANLTILSNQFAMTFLLVMGLFALSNISLKFNRDRLVRQPRASLPIVLLALIIVLAAIAGNIAMSPPMVGYFAVFFLIATVGMTYTAFHGKLAIALYWIYDRNPKLHSWRRTKHWSFKLSDRIQKSRERPTVFFAKTDAVSQAARILINLKISILNEAIRRIKECESTSKHLRYSWRSLLNLHRFNQISAFFRSH